MSAHPKCDFCGKQDGDELNIFVSSADVLICDVCVGLAGKVVADVRFERAVKAETARRLAGDVRPIAYLAEAGFGERGA